MTKKLQKFQKPRTERTPIPYAAPLPRAKDPDELIDAVADAFAEAFAHLRERD